MKNIEKVLKENSKDIMLFLSLMTLFIYLFIDNKPEYFFSSLIFLTGLFLLQDKKTLNEFF